MALAAIGELIKCPDRDPCTVTEIPDMIFIKLPVASTLLCVRVLENQ
jgi:hypothetical protein